MKSVIFGPKRELCSVSDVIDAIKNNEREEVSVPARLRFLYRGHANTEYKLSPSIAREVLGIRNEVRLIDIARNKLPQEFSSALDRLTLLAKMQHHGLPTRLIDVTINPLVALYFACQNEETDGEVLIFTDHIYPSGSSYSRYSSMLYNDEWNPEDRDSFENKSRLFVECFYSHAFIRELILSLIDVVTDDGIYYNELLKKIYQKPWFQDWASKTGFWNWEDADRSMCIMAMLKVPVVVEAQETLERQRIQQGLYLLLPNDVQLKEGKCYILNKLPDLKVENTNIGRWFVKAANKKKILHELDMIGINEGFLFGDSIDHVCAYIKRMVCE